MHCFCKISLCLYFLLQFSICKTQENQTEVNQIQEIRKLNTRTEETTTPTDEIDEVNVAIHEYVLTNANKPIFFELRKPVEPFLGRIAELEELKYGFEEDKITVLVGPRGIGKTELARKYAQQVKHDNTSNILWIDTRTHEIMFGAFKDLGISLGFKVEETSFTTTMREVFEYFENRKTLVIFDHANSDNIILRNLNTFIKPPWKRIHFLVTSRKDDWNIGEDNDFKIIKVPPFTPDLSLQYIRNVISKELDLPMVDTSINQLSNQLKHLPLALKTAAKYIIQHNTRIGSEEYTIEDYIQDLSSHNVPEVPQAAEEPKDNITDETILQKIKEESERITKQIENEAKYAWESITVESERTWKNIEDESERFGKKISDQAAKLEEKVKNFFKIG